ncbi:MAG: hypothetical protein Q9Q13_09155 [Acidobacteriota bacterium]|nr:hypothetical protein [Acidobacteriota bacterium]
MLNKIIEWSLRNQFFVVVAVIFAIVAGFWAINSIRLDAIPDLSDVQVIYTQYRDKPPSGRGPDAYPCYLEDAHSQCPT